MSQVYQLFSSNEEDDRHCYQASLRMVLYRFLQKDYSFKEIDEITGFQKGKPTWPFMGMLSLSELGFEVRNIELFDAHLFAVDMKQAIEKQVGAEVAERIISISDVEKETSLAQQCRDNTNIRFEYRIPSLSDITNLLSKGYAIICNVNYWALLEEDKYNGHFVVVEKVSDDGVLIQNPGLPPIQDQLVTTELFMNSWYSPQREAGNIIAIKRKA